jgi:acyl-CoA reductase-like NAD-dependent aldehyde dehydrogenase
VSSAPRSAFGAAGQRCLAGSIAVLVGTAAEQDAARDRIVEAAAGLRTGAGDDPPTDVCPVVSPSARERLVEEIDRAEADGAVTSTACSSPAAGRNPSRRPGSCAASTTSPTANRSARKRSRATSPTTA